MSGRLFRFVVSGKSVAELKDNMERALSELNGEGTITSEVPQDFLTQAAVQPGPLSNEKPAHFVTPPIPSPTPTPSHSASASAQPSPNSIGVDSTGLPWDGRIHSSNMATTKDGSWRTRRGVEPAYVKQIEHELIAKIKSGGAAPAPTFQTPPVPGLQRVEPVNIPAVPSPALPSLQPNTPLESTPATPMGNVYPPPAPSIAPVAAVQPPSVQPTAPSFAIPAAPPAAMTSTHSAETFAANFPLVLSHLVTEGKLTQEYIALLKNYFNLEQIYQANDQQKVEIFETFCKAGIITKAGG